MSGRDDDDEKAVDSFRIPIRPKDAARIRELGEKAGKAFRAGASFFEAIEDLKRTAGDKPRGDATRLGEWNDCPCAKGGAFQNGQHLTCEFCGRVFDPPTRAWSTK